MERFKSKIDSNYTTTASKRVTSMSWGSRQAKDKKLVDDVGACQKCGSKTGLTVDHINPIWNTTQGQDGQWYNPDGTHMDDRSNLQVICGGCHKAKSYEDQTRFFTESPVGRIVKEKLMEYDPEQQRLASYHGCLATSRKADEQAFRVQGMVGGGAARKDIMRIRSISLSTVKAMIKRKLDEHGKSETTRRLEQQILSY